MPPRKTRINKVQTPLLPQEAALTRDEALALRPQMRLYTFRTSGPDTWALFYTRKLAGQMLAGRYDEHDHHEQEYPHEIEANQAFHEAVSAFDRAHR